MTFKAGDSVVCISKSGGWYDAKNNFEQVPGPSFNEVLTVDALEDGYFLVFSKYGSDGYDPNMFRKVQPKDDSFVEWVIGFITGKKKHNNFEY